MVLRPLVIALALVPAVAFGAVKKTRTTVRKPAATTTTTTTTETGSDVAESGTRSSEGRTTAILGGRELPEYIHEHLSLFVNYNLADTITDKNGTKTDVDRDVQLGAQYKFTDFTPGIGAQIGGSYDFSRDVKNTNLKLHEWLAYAELTGRLIPRLTVMGGPNYNLPSVDNMPNGVSIKGKLGYQLGASYDITDNLAVDGRYRYMEMELSGNNTTATIYSSGFILGGRFIF